MFQKIADSPPTTQSIISTTSDDQVQNEAIISDSEQQIE